VYTRQRHNRNSAVPPSGTPLPCALSSFAVFPSSRFIFLPFPPSPILEFGIWNCPSLRPLPPHKNKNMPYMRWMRMERCAPTTYMRWRSGGYAVPCGVHADDAAESSVTKPPHGLRVSFSFSGSRFFCPHFSVEQPRTLRHNNFHRRRMRRYPPEPAEHPPNTPESICPSRS
jgi:hypothetical protein